jgi:uncharacterized protein YjbI with pentapeptide repeats
MNELDNSSARTESANQVISHALPDWSIYGYQVYEKLSERKDLERITYLAIDLHSVDRASVVIKEWRILDRDASSLDYANYLPTIERLQQLDHLNIPHYLNSFATPTGFCVVREYQSGVSLAELGTLSRSDIKLVADAVLKILTDLQQLQPIVIHQNIKPENIIVNTETELMVYLVDFGLHSHSEDRVTTGTPGFIPPEQLLNLDLTSASDIYSLGVSLICSIVGISTEKAQYLLDDRYRPQFQHLLPENTDSKTIAWLEKMVEPDYQQRYLDASSAHYPTVNLSLKHPKVNSVLNEFPTRKKINWMKWGITVSILFGLGLIARQFISSDEPEISPAQIARNQSIVKQAEFDASDRGKLIKEKRCISCNFDYQNFAKAELTGAIVSQSSLNGANFSGANLTLAIFRDADLNGANLSKANLQQAALYGANLIGANLVGANLSNAKLVYAKLKGSSLRDTNLSNTDLKFAEFQQVDLTNANLTDADLSNADLSYSNLSNAILVGAKLDGANLTGATMPNGSTHP